MQYVLDHIDVIYFLLILRITESNFLIASSLSKFIDCFPTVLIIFDFNSGK